MDPTGNITALVTTAVDVAEQPAVAAEIMVRHPDVEQVGFVTFAEIEEPSERDEAQIPVSLRMAGGEFCGNATMCAAALYLLTKEAGAAVRTVKVKVSGAAAPLEVTLKRTDRASYDPETVTPMAAGVCFEASVAMPPAIGIEDLKLSNGMLPGSSSLKLPIVRMEGIAHVIIEPDSGFFGLKDDPALAETLLRGWCGVLDAECLGMMFLGEEQLKCDGPGTGNAAAVRQMTPLVYVPGADTMFWENSCASGSAAAGIYLAAQAGTPVDITLAEPAGRLRVESDPLAQKTILHGSVILTSN